jgi:hypothetical protein
MELKNLLTVNLSDNPLVTISFEGWVNRITVDNFCLESLKLRGIRLGESLRKELVPVFIRAKIIDCS